MAVRSQPVSLAVSRPTSQQILYVGEERVLVVRKRIKNLYMRIRPTSGEIEISAPTRASDEYITQFVNQRLPWVERQRSRLAERQRQFDKQHAGGSPLLTWTKESERQARVRLEELIPPLVEKWSAIIGRSPSHITVRRMTSRWGSCTPASRRIRLNLQLGVMDQRFLEYVLVHEMTHLWVNGHGEQFQKRMDSYLPQWRQLRREINQHIVW